MITGGNQAMSDMRDQPWTFTEFVQAQDITPEERAMWTEEQQKEAYSAYIAMFYTNRVAVGH